MSKREEEFLGALCLPVFYIMIVANKKSRLTEGVSVCQVFTVLTVTRKVRDITERRCSRG